MIEKYVVNHLVVSLQSIVLILFVVFVEIIAWKLSIFYGILTMILFIGVLALGIKYMFEPARIKSLTINSNGIEIEYSKNTVSLPFETWSKLAHYKRGPLTERILIQADGFIHVIPWDMKMFHKMCRNIYESLLENNMEHIADDWFQEKFGQ